MSARDWAPMNPATVTLSVECEGHDVDTVRAALTNAARIIRSDYGHNVGPVSVATLPAGDES